MFMLVIEKLVCAMLPAFGIDVLISGNVSEREHFNLGVGALPPLLEKWGREEYCVAMGVAG